MEEVVIQEDRETRTENILPMAKIVVGIIQIQKDQILITVPTVILTGATGITAQILTTQIVIGDQVLLRVRDQVFQVEADQVVLVPGLHPVVLEAVVKEAGETNRIKKINHYKPYYS